MLALFPFLHATSYPATLVSCKQNEIVLKSEESDVVVTLFNLKITDPRGWEQACSLIKNTDNLRFEIDPSSSVKEPIPVYLFADDQLVQEEVIKSGYGYPMIKNPEYTYENRLEAAFNSMKTVAKPVEKKETKTHASVGPLYLFSIFVIWLVMLFVILKKGKKKVQ